MSMTNEAALKLLDQVIETLGKLRETLADTDEEKRRISMLVAGIPNLHIINPKQYEKMAPYADETLKPYTFELWSMQGHFDGDLRKRLPHFQVGAPDLPGGNTNPSAPWDSLTVGGEDG